MTLQTRTTTKTISKPNGRKALERLSKELQTLIVNCPEENRHYVEQAIESAHKAIVHIAKLYAKKEL